VVPTREHYADGHQQIWFLIDTQAVKNPERLSEQARKKIAAKCHRIGRELNGALQNLRPP
jgi:hypothetical protein